MALSSWLCTNNTKNMIVKIVLPSGRVELHDRPILAADIMLKYPRCCVTYPHVFRQPWAVVTPDTVLMLGHKFYVVPLSTLRKLQRKHLKRPPSFRRQADLNAQNYVYQLIKHDGQDGADPSCWFFSGKSTPNSSYWCFGQSEHEMEECRSGQEESCFMCLIPGAKSVGEDGPSRNRLEESNIGESPKRNSISTAWQPSLARISEDEIFYDVNLIANPPRCQNGISVWKSLWEKWTAEINLCSRH